MIHLVRRTQKYVIESTLTKVSRKMLHRANCCLTKTSDVWTKLVDIEYKELQCRGDRKGCVE